MNTSTVEVLTFRTTRADHPYWFPLSGMVYGVSVGHIALRFKFNDPELFNKYIKDPAGTRFSSGHKYIQRFGPKCA